MVKRRGEDGEGGHGSGLVLTNRTLQLHRIKDKEATLCLFWVIQTIPCSLFYHWHFNFLLFSFLQVFSHNRGGFPLCLVRRLQLRREGCKKGGQGWLECGELHRAALGTGRAKGHPPTRLWEQKPWVTFFSSFLARSLKQIRSAFRPTFVIRLKEAASLSEGLLFSDAVLSLLESRTDLTFPALLPEYHGGKS